MRMFNSYQELVNFARSELRYKGDNTERLAKISAANKTALKGKHWMNKDGVSIRVAP